MGWDPFASAPTAPAASPGPTPAPTPPDLFEPTSAQPPQPPQPPNIEDLRKRYDPREFDRDLVFSANRLLTGVSVGFLAGLALGGAHDAKWAGLRYRAEHAHRLPTSQVGWYLYHKSKNYIMMSAGVRGAVRTAFMVSSWASLFFGIEETLRMSRRKTDFINTTVAGLCSGGCFSLWKWLDTRTTARNISLGIKVGLGVGLLTDLAGAARGREIWYIERIRSRYLGLPKNDLPAE